MDDVDSAFHFLAHHIEQDDITPIGWQAHEIVTSILDDESPDLAEIKWRLRRCLAANPGSPQRALLAHLMETSELANSDGGQ